MSRMRVCARARASRVRPANHSRLSPRKNSRAPRLSIHEVRRRDETDSVDEAMGRVIGVLGGYTCAEHSTGLYCTRTLA